MHIDLIRHREIRKRLREAGSSISALARELSVAPETVTIVSQGYRKSHRVQTAIAETLGVTPAELFPERYAEQAGQKEMHKPRH